MKICRVCISRLVYMNFHNNIHIVGVLARCPCVARKIKILWEKRMNEGKSYMQMWRGVWVFFCNIAIVSFLSVRYTSFYIYRNL